MRTIREIQDSIKALKAETGVCILAHSYQSPEILEVADIIGDSYKLSAAAGEVPAEKLLLCGVHFMAETAKLLNPEKQVYEANPDAGCPMAEQFPAEVISAAKEKIPGCAVVAYVNTTAAVKAVSDVCVTSSSAVKIVGNMTQRIFSLFRTAISVRIHRSTVRISGCISCREDVRITVQLRSKTHRLQRQRILLRCCWCIRSADQPSRSWRIMSAQPPGF